jgi:hypothetical protein
MKYPDMAAPFTSRSLAKRDSLSSVRRWEWLVDEQQRHEIAARLRELRDNSIETNRSIGDYCHVAERTVAGWASPTHPRGLTFDHAQMVAKLFDLDWFWRGREQAETPDLNGSIGQKLDAIQEDVRRLLELVAPIAGAQAAADAPRPKPQRRSRSARESPASEKKRRVANGPAG